MMPVSPCAYCQATPENVLATLVPLSASTGAPVPLTLTRLRRGDMTFGRTGACDVVVAAKDKRCVADVVPTLAFRHRLRC